MTRIIMLAALAAAPCFAPALAESSVHTEVVSYADLDLSNQDDLRKLDRRIRTAVQTVCGAPSDADPAGKNEIRHCRAETTARLEAQRALAIAAARRLVRTAAAD